MKFGIFNTADGFGMSRRLQSVLMACLSLLAIGVLSASPAMAQESTLNPNPIDWKVDQLFIGNLGNTIPLRMGQHDYGDVDGFGVHHIIDGHGMVPPHDVIDDTLRRGTCELTGADRFTCQTEEAIVVFVTSNDRRSGDDMAFGIITAYFKPFCDC